MGAERAIITIGREYGSGGREIGTLVAEKLGVKFFDKEILTRAAEESGLCEELFHRHDERAGVGAMLSGAATSGTGIHMSGAPLGLQMPLNQRVFLAQFDAITKIAAEGPCVIVGRCADYVLKERPGVTHVFIYASTEKPASCASCGWKAWIMTTRVSLFAKQTGNAKATTISLPTAIGVCAAIMI